MTTIRLITGDGPEWCRTNHAPSVFTSLPDPDETGMDFATWRGWFWDGVALAIWATDPDGYAIFYQTDRRHDGILESKASMVTSAAKACGAAVVWHKIAVRRMSIDLFRPAYTHLIAVSVNGKAGRPTPDVFNAGAKVYPNATDQASLDVALNFLAARGIREIADPYCGRGSIPLAAALRGIDSTGVDIDPAQIDAAEELIGMSATVTREGAA